MSKPRHRASTHLISLIETLDARVLLSASTVQIFVPDSDSNAVGQYDSAGNTVNASLISGLNDPSAIAISGQDVFVVSNYAGTIGEYTTSGSVVNASLITGLQEPTGIAVSGNHIFVAQYDYNSQVGFVGEYTLTGSTVKGQLISGLESPEGIAVSGSDLFVTDSGTGTVGEYTTSGAAVNASLISGLDGPEGVAISGSDLFVAQNYSGTVGEYTITGSTVNDSLVSGFDSPDGMAVSGSNLFVQDDDGTIGEYSATDGSVINASLLSLDSPTGIAVLAAPGQQQQSTPQLVFMQEPTSTTAGSSFNPGITIEALDASGNVAIDDKSKITLMLSSGAKLIGTTTESVKNGVATFSKLSIDQAGTYTLTASTPNYTSAISSSFTISPAAAAHLAFSSVPVTASINTPMTISLELTDRYGNTVDDGSTVNLTLGSHPHAASSLNLTTVVDDNGSANFDAVTLDASGNYTLFADDGKLKAASKKFVVG